MQFPATTVHHAYAGKYAKAGTYNQGKYEQEGKWHFGTEQDQIQSDYVRIIDGKDSTKDQYDDCNGIANYLFHGNTQRLTSCYLKPLSYFSPTTQKRAIW
jgi:hypothetical protein